MESAVSTFRSMLCAGALAACQAAAGAQTIYKCDSADGLIFSDRPCGADAAVHASDDSLVTIADAPAISKRASAIRPSPSKPDKSTQKSVAAEAKRQASCARLDQSLRELRSKLRAGYGVKEGERLKARQRQLAERRRAEKCG